MQCDHLRDEAHQWCVHRGEHCAYPQCAHEDNSVIYCPGRIRAGQYLDPAVDLLTPSEVINCRSDMLPLTYVNPERINNGCMIYRAGAS